MTFDELLDLIDDPDLKELLQLLWEEKADLTHQHSSEQIRNLEAFVQRVVAKAKPKDGVNGKDGKDGRAGRDGRDGKPGQDAVAVDGKDGRNGIDGADGKGFTWRGRWAKDTLYQPYDVVEFYGSSYVALKENANPPILSPDEWDLMASAGGSGGTGAQGPQGVKGDDGEDSDLIQRIVFGTTPTPAPNGVQKVFTTQEPYLAGTLQVFRGSLRMYPTLDVAETDPSAGTFTLTVAPDSNEPLLVGYIKA